ncbi:ferredoxin-thioredoxin reductase catalytic chain, chloroplastic [Hordeum vulgare]|nr:ferredoxin-thioredoxin reductase catalytic chain, chloroplastic [Hordeum vulgare]
MTTPYGLATTTASSSPRTRAGAQRPAAMNGEFAWEWQLRDHRRAHGLCFKCGDLYSREHRCKQPTQLLAIQLGDHGEVLTGDGIHAMDLLEEPPPPAPLDQVCCVLSTHAVPGAAGDGGAADSSEQKSVEIMRKFSEQYARRSSTFFCSDKSVTAVVIKTRHYDDKAAEAAQGFWNCPCVPMRERFLLTLGMKTANKFFFSGEISLDNIKVFDLSVVKRSDFVRYGLGCLERLADQGDNCTKNIRANLRIMVAGGDGTVG